ncbi:MAG TPA: response regulator [Bacteroidia bacterium]|jgi:CheY-like chemotaxis protein
MAKYQRILLIDDDEDDREIFLTALDRLVSPVICEAFGSARLALDHLSEKKVQTDLIFLDLNMPLMNGQQFLMEIKKHPELKNIPVIIFSTTSHLPTIELMKELGAMDFITKPEGFTELVNTLKATLN